MILAVSRGSLPETTGIVLAPPDADRTALAIGLAGWLVQIWWTPKTLKRLVAATLSLMCVLVQAPLGARHIERETAAQRQEQPAAPTLTFSGFVRRKGNGVADVRLRLRDANTGSIVSETVSGADGAFSFSIPAPGLYVVEAIGSDGKVIAVSQPSRVGTTPVIGDVVLPSAPLALVWIATSVFVLTAAADAGILPWEGGATSTPTATGNVASPER